MGRKKKKKDEDSDKESSENREAVIGRDAIKSIVAVCIAAFGAVVFLALIGYAGSVGEIIDENLALAVGWSRFLLVLFLLLLSVLIIRRKESSLSEKIKYTGLVISFLAVLGITHLFLGETSQELREVAEKGEGGGYIGYLLASQLKEAFGAVASIVVLLALFSTGVIAAFNFSLVNFLVWIREKLFKKEEAEEVPQAEGVEEGTPAEEVSSIEVSSVEEKVPEENIQNVRFSGLDDVSSVSTNVPIISPEALNPTLASDSAMPAAMPAASLRRRPKLRWEFPPLDLLEATTGKGGGGDIEQTKKIIVSTLKYFGIEVEPGEVQVGPTVAQYTFRPAVGVKLSRITALNNDLALALAAHPIRIEAPIPGKSLIGIEVPNREKAFVRLKDILGSKEYRERSSNLTVALGQDVSGKFVLADLGKMPHLLIAGATNSGKSVCVNTILLSLLYQNSPEDLKLILVDPKRVELSLYKGIPHLRADVIVDNHKVVNALKWAVSEMEERYKNLEAVGSRDLASYREKVLRGEKRTVYDEETGETRQEELRPMPQLVIVIDEMADLMVAHGKEVESVIIRLAQMSRAVGIHLILATQRPSVEVITGLIKANIPARIAFSVTNQIDSRTILDSSGAEKLLGKGDMLYSPAGETVLKRIQGVFASEAEVNRVVKFLVDQKEEKGLDEIGEDFGGESGAGDITVNAGSGDGEDDEYFEAAKQLVVNSQRFSTTYLQTALKIGYPKAARLTELLERKGVIGPAQGNKREVLMKSLDDSGKKYGDDPMADQAARDKFGF